MWQEPIFDRTYNDAIYARTQKSKTETELKGSFDFRTANRIKNNLQYIDDILFREGFLQLLKQYEDFERSSDFRSPDFAKLVTNLTSVVENYYTYISSPNLPTYKLTEKLKYDTINSIEKLIFDINELIYKMIDAYIYCGEIESGDV
ncbi:MAG: hypothetical protein R3Y09_13235 [Clostridia bacterium]